MIFTYIKICCVIKVLPINNSKISVTKEHILKINHEVIIITLFYYSGLINVTILLAFMQYTLLILNKWILAQI